MEHESYHELSKGQCDCCGVDGLISVFHLRGTPVVGTCAVCSRQDWEAAGTQAKEAFLAGETTYSFR